VNNTEHINREYEARAKDEADARSILDTAATESRDLSPEEEERFDRFIASSDARKARIEKLTKLDSDAVALESAVRSRIGDVTDSTSGSTQTQTFSNAGLLANIRAIQAEYKGSRSERELFIEMPVDMERRAIADFSDSGALYTTDFATQVAVYQRTVSPWINLASIINADNGRPLNLPNLTVDPTSYTNGEGTAITESTPTIGSAALTTTAYKALSYLSAESTEDELVGLMPLVAKAQGRSIGLKFGSDLTVALVAAVNNGGTAGGLSGGGTATFFGYEDLLDLKYGRQYPYRQVGVWIMSNGAIKKVRKFTDKNGQYLWQPAGYSAIAGGQPDTFDGQPVYEDPYLAAPASATKSVIYGDPSAVVIKQMALRVATSTEFKFDIDQVALKTVYRAGGKVADVTALAFLVSANT
jgi:HK97 family phage major capsid protein